MKTGYLALVLWSVACGPSPGQGDGGNHDNGDGQNGPCTDGTTRCEGNDVMVCQNGTFVVREACSGVCSEGLGCTLCRPGTGTCNGDISTVCRADGTGLDEVLCDPALGLACDSNTGACEGACSPANLGTSYIGCEYFPTVTANGVNYDFAFAVAVSNTGSQAATVRIEGGALSTPVGLIVAPGAVAVQTLPWVQDLRACAVSGPVKACTFGFGVAPDFNDRSRLSRLVAGGAYRLRSTQPVTVYQFNPLDYATGVDTYSYSNDASLLIPANAMGQDYLVATYPARSVGFPSLLAVTAARDNTEVTVTTTVTVAGGEGGTFTAGQPRTVGLNQGDVLQLFANSPGQDLTGSVVTSAKPVEVIGGHFCVDIPAGVPYCDHIEESMFPVAALSTRYIVNAPAMTTIPGGKVQVVRIVATTPNTTLTYDPPQAGAPTTIANAGGFAEIVGQAASYLLIADHKVLVAQYMEGQNAGGGMGDPALALAVPIDQFRTQYLFHAPTNYQTNYVDITAPTGATVTLDGNLITAFTPIGAGGFGLARVLSLGPGPGSDGNHSINSGVPFGITVYGYGTWTSYWYPGGLDLDEIIVQ